MSDILNSKIRHEVIELSESTFTGCEINTSQLIGDGNLTDCVVNTCDPVSTELDLRNTKVNLMTRDEYEASTK